MYIKNQSFFMVIPTTKPGLSALSWYFIDYVNRIELRILHLLPTHIRTGIIYWYISLRKVKSTTKAKLMVIFFFF